MSAAFSVTGNDRIVDGGNVPPAFDAHKANVDDLRAEAASWLDGGTITTAEEAEAVSLLMEMARKAKSAGDKARLEATKPHRDMTTKLNAQWETQVTGPADMIASVCSKALTPWNLAEKQRKEAEAARIRAEQEAEVDALRAARAESDGSLESVEQIDQLEASVKQATKAAKSAEKAAGKGNGLRVTYRAEITDFAAAARHYWAPERDRFQALVLEFAQRDVRAGKRDIPGVNAIPEHKAV